MLCMSSGMLPSYRLGCASAWLVYVVVVVYGQGRVHQRLQRGAVGLGWCHYASQMADDHAAVDMAATPLTRNSPHQKTRRNR